jgi:shikimate kinase
MPLIYVTGIAGAGKSTVCGELVRRGFEAYDTDDNGFSYWQDMITGEITGATHAAGRSAEFSTRNQWKMDPERVRSIAKKARERAIFLCGSASNDAEFSDLFAKVIHLSIDRTTMQERVTTRSTSDYGKNANELTALTELHERIDGHYRTWATTSLDANQPTSEIVDQIIAEVEG